MAIPVAVSVDWLPAILIVGGVAASSRLLAAGSKAIQAVLNGIGFFIGIVAVLLAGLALSGHVLDSFTIALTVITGLLLILRPLKNVRWAALLGLSAGALTAYFAWAVLHVTSQVILLVAGLVVALLVYVIFKFAEDILHVAGGILSFPPIAIAIGLIAILHGVLLLFGSGIPDLMGPFFPSLAASR